jgi:putative transposase
MHRMDELHLDFPFAGSRMLRDLLNADGVEIGRLHVATLMKRMGIEAIYRKPPSSRRRYSFVWSVLLCPSRLSDRR